MSEEKPTTKAKSKPSPQVWKYYKIDGESVVLLKKECPRCGKGVFLADHKERQSCGKCGFTQFNRSDK